MEWIFEIAKEHGLFVALVAYVIWDSRLRESKFVEREYKYMAVIQTLSEEVKERLTKIESRLGRRKPDE